MLYRKSILAKTTTKLEAVIGHSLGEIAACCVAGVLSLREAARLVVLRGRAVATKAIEGATVAVSASAEEVEALVNVEVAADNSMNGCAIAGEVDAVDVAIEALTEQGLKTKSCERPRATTRAASTRVWRTFPPRPLQRLIAPSTRR